MSDSSGGAPRGRVLVVEHDQQRGRLVEKMLRRRGLQPQRVGSGVEALLVLREQEVELVITEADLSDMGGEELITAVRRTGRRCRTALLGGDPAGAQGLADAHFPHPLSLVALGHFAAPPRPDTEG
ncbi:MAG: hypothetical protein JNM72_10305 [Deltaproteobacteria bacterium]|jgi:CheY-like chemotaxis protein|nr:hypothetical protein [Deltaproteobacteria bacterium]